MTLKPYLAPYKGFIFDMDGTLVDNMGIHNQAWVAWAETEGLPHTPEEVLGLTHGTLKDIVSRFFPEAAIEHSLERGAKKEALYREMFGDRLAAIDGLVPFLDALRAEGKQIALATAGDLENVAFILDGLHLRGYFDFIVTGEEVAEGKPHPEVFEKALQGLGLPATECVIFEDSPAGIEAARRAGVAAVLVHPWSPREAFTQRENMIAEVGDCTELLEVKP